MLCTEEKNIIFETARRSLTSVFNVSTVFVPGSFFGFNQILLYAVINLNATFANINIFNPPGLAVFFRNFELGLITLKSSLLAGDCLNKFYILLSIKFTFHSATEWPVWKDPCKTCSPQLPRFKSVFSINLPKFIVIKF